MAQILSRQAKPFPPLSSHMVIVLLQSLIHRKKVFLKQFMNSFILTVSNVCSLFSHSTKPAPHLFLLAAGTGQHRLFPAPCCTSPHPLQNRVPRVQVLLPLPIHLSPGSAKIAWPGDFSYLCDPGHGLSIPSSCCIRCCPLTPARNRFLPPFSPPAPKTHPVSSFSAQTGCVSPFLSSFDSQNFGAVFCAFCRIAFTG